MADMLFGLSGGDVEILRRVVRSVLQDELRQLSRNRGRPVPAINVREGIFDAQLVAGNNTGVAFSVYTQAGTSWADTMENITAKWPTGKGVTIASGAYGMVMMINDEWRPIMSEC
jgi:hypothetical protein